MPQKPHKLVFFGTSEFAVPILRRLQSDPDFSILEVITQPDRPVGRKHMLNAPAVKRAAATLGLKVYQPESVRDEAVIAHVSGLAADAFVVVSYGKILPKKLLDAPPFGGINVHASLLPSYRGASPISAAILARDKETGVTIMKMDEKMDEGPTLAMNKVPIDDADTTGTLTPKLAAAAAEMICPTLKLYLEGLLEPKPQDHALASYAGILTREDGHIDWKKSAEDIEHLIRAMQPWPEAYALWTRKGASSKLIVKKASVLHPTRACDTIGKIGGVCKLAGGGVGVNCGTGSLLLERVQLEGKNEVDAKSFLNGYPDFIGAELA